MSKGVTLVEVMVTLTIVVIFAVLFGMTSAEISRSSANLMKLTTLSSDVDRLVSMARNGDFLPAEDQSIRTITQQDSNIVINNMSAGFQNIFIYFEPSTGEHGIPASAEYAPDGVGPACINRRCHFIYLEPVRMGVNEFIIGIAEVKDRIGTRTVTERRYFIVK